MHNHPQQILHTHARHAHLIGSRPMGTEQRKLTAIRFLALIIDISEKVAQEAIHLYNVGEMLVPKVVGWPVHTIEPEVAYKLQELVLNGNKNGMSIHSKLLVAELTNQGTTVNIQTLQCYLKALGFCDGKGNRRNILYGMEANIDFQNVYLEKRLTNLNANALLVVPKLFLDKPYCHFDHHTRLTWVLAKGVVNKHGCQPMLVIFGAFVIFCQDNKLEANMV